MRKLFHFIILTWGLSSTHVWSVDLQSQLDEADELRLSDSTKAIRILSSLDELSLSDSQRHQYAYLQAYLLSVKGYFRRGYEGYANLLPKPLNNNLRVRVLQSMLNLSPHIGEWYESVRLANSLRVAIDKVEEHNVKLQGYKGLAAYYLSIHDYDAVIAISENALLLAEVGSDPYCFIKNIAVESRYKKTGELPLSTEINRLLNQCNDLGTSHHSLSIKLLLIEDAIGKRETLIAGEYLAQIENELKAEVQDYLRQKLFVLKASHAFLAGNRLAGVDYAQQALDNKLGATDALTIEALRLLSSDAESLGDFQRASELQKRWFALESKQYHQELVNQSAIQKARLEVALKDAQITQLDKQNKLLQTETELANQQVKNSFLALGFAVAVLVAMMLWLYRSRVIQNQFKRIARIDALTGIYNRGYFSTYTTLVLQRSQSASFEVALILLDIDFFKRINDNYGHLVGDWALRSVVRCLQNYLPENAIFARMGGEEFGILLPKSSLEEAVALANNCKNGISQIDTSDAGVSFEITASFGVCSTKQVGTKLDNLFSGADLALYRSKQEGRNRVFTYENEVLKTPTQRVSS